MASCRIPGCTFATDGKCSEGRGANCPNLITDTSSDAVVERSDAADGMAPGPYSGGEELFSGLPLEIAEAQEISRARRTIVVALAGMAESGKTSLLARLHQQFQNGPVGGYEFAEGRTLARFEELNWLATVESGVSAPMMKHSSRQEDNSFLHFGVRSQPDGALVNVLLNDISGETFPDAIAIESVCEQLICVRRADHLGLVIDGAAIADRSLRHNHHAGTKSFVQRLLQTGQIGTQTILHLIISKLDELHKGENAAESVRAATDLESDFVSRFGNQVGDIYKWRIAARPRDGSLPTEATIAELFATWCKTTRRYPASPPPDADRTSFARDFSRFGI